jgi:phosphatidylserine/phosphatidylglycerophosphate/cardiolipin synthase-like enzyme
MCVWAPVLVPISAKMTWREIVHLMSMYVGMPLLGCTYTIVILPFAAIGAMVRFAMHAIWSTSGSVIKFIIPSELMAVLTDDRWQWRTEETVQNVQTIIGLALNQLVAYWHYLRNTEEVRKDVSQYDKARGANGKLLDRKKTIIVYRDAAIWISTMERLKRANGRVWISTMYIRDTPGSLVAELINVLNELTQRKVEVRLLCDGYGAWWANSWKCSARWKFPARSLGPVSFIASHHCYHAKFILIDDSVFGVTGSNTGDIYYNTPNGLHDSIMWFDRATASQMDSLTTEFARCWENGTPIGVSASKSLLLSSSSSSSSPIAAQENHNTRDTDTGDEVQECNRHGYGGDGWTSKGFNCAPYKQSTVTKSAASAVTFVAAAPAPVNNEWVPLFFGPDCTEDTLHTLVKEIRHAKHRIVLCSISFAPSVQLYRELTNALLRGVQVDILTVDAFAHQISGKVAAIAEPRLIMLARAGATVYRENPGRTNAVCHSKWWLFDSVLYYGSANLTHFTFQRTHDIMLRATNVDPLQWIDAITGDEKSNKATSEVVGEGTAYHGYDRWDDLYDEELDSNWRRTVQYMAGTVTCAF